MDYMKFLESTIGSFLGKSKRVRFLIMKLYAKQQNKKKIAVVPDNLVQIYGEKEIMNFIKNHDGNGDLTINGSVIKFYSPNIPYFKR